MDYNESTDIHGAHVNFGSCSTGKSTLPVILAQNLNQILNEINNSQGFDDSMTKLISHTNGWRAMKFVTFVTFGDTSTFFQRHCRAKIQFVQLFMLIKNHIFKV